MPNGRDQGGEALYCLVDLSFVLRLSCLFTTNDGVSEEIQLLINCCFIQVHLQ